MAEQDTKGNGQTEERDKRQERADRILDVAAELLLRFGYKKTTIDDIARQAGVAKGTIYLHWKTRDDLFMDLIIREKIKTARQVEQDIANDPAGFSLYTLIKYSLLASLRQPLNRGLLLHDTEMLGKMVNEAYQEASVLKQYDQFVFILSHLREQGSVRTDMTITAQINLILAVIFGFLIYDQYTPNRILSSEEERAELAGETIQRALEVRTPQTSRTAQDNTPAQALNKLIDMLQEYRSEKEIKDE